MLPLLSSFKPDSLAARAPRAATLPRALLLDTLSAGWFERAQALGCVAVVTNHKLCRPRLVARLHAAGLRAMVYTVNDAAAARQLLDLGLDGMITDAVDRFSP